MEVAGGALLSGPAFEALFGWRQGVDLWVPGSLGPSGEGLGWFRRSKRLASFFFSFLFTTGFCFFRSQSSGSVPLLSRNIHPFLITFLYSSPS